LKKLFFFEEIAMVDKHKKNVFSKKKSGVFFEKFACVFYSKSGVLTKSRSCGLQRKFDG